MYDGPHQQPGIEKLDPWVQSLLDAEDSVARDRVLLDATLALSSARAIALWRRVEANRWAPWLTRGGRGELPTSGWIEAALRGEVAAELPGGTYLIGKESGVRALVVSGLHEEERDLVEALCTTRNLCEDTPSLEPGEASIEDWLDELPWLPRADREENTDPDG